MRSRAVARVMLALLLTSMFVLAFNVNSAEAVGTIYIRADGSVDPVTAPIRRDGDTYTLTGNINNSIVIEKDDIVLDGAGHAVLGTGGSVSIGISLYGRKNVTIVNVQVRNFGSGIYLHSSFNNGIRRNNIKASSGAAAIVLGYSSSNDISANVIEASRAGIGLGSSSGNDISANDIRASSGAGIGLGFSSNNSLSENNITGNGEGIELFHSSDNSLIANNIRANKWTGIWLESSSGNSIKANNITNHTFVDYSFGVNLFSSAYNHISENNIVANRGGIGLDFSSNYNSISENNIADNNIGVVLGKYPSSNNTIYHNNFINNALQIFVSSIRETGVNVWDNGYTFGGNYWSNYTGVDVKSGLNQDVPGSDGIGDTSHIVDARNRDRYPLMKPYATPVEIRDFTVLSVTPNVREVCTGLSIDINVSLENRGERADNRTITVYHDSHVIGSQTVKLVPNENITLTFTWDTADTPLGNRTLKAIANIVIAEANTTDNALETIVRIKILGDVNGDDKVDIRDLAEAATAFGTYLGSPGWNPQADLNQDDTTDIRDLVLIAKNFGKTYQ